MPRMKESGGIPPHLKVIANLKVGEKITPTKIDELITYTKGYASKYIFDLKTLGFVFKTTKNGRNIVDWELVLEPANAEELREKGRNPSRRTINKQANELLKDIGL